MTIEHAAEPAAAEASYPWLREGRMPPTREDLLAEGVALAALLFSVVIGIVIAALPVSGAEAEILARPAVAVRARPAPAAPALPAPASPRDAAAAGRS